MRFHSPVRHEASDAQRHVGAVAAEDEVTIRRGRGKESAACLRRMSSLSIGGRSSALLK